MIRKLICLLTVLTVGFALTPSARADTEAIGTLSFILSSSPQGEFDVTNLTGANFSNSSDLPVATQLLFSGLSLSGVSEGFSPNADGISWDGAPIVLGAGVTSVTLTGTPSPTTATLFDSSVVSLLPTFSATLTDPTGIKDGDFVIIYATTGTVDRKSVV